MNNKRRIKIITCIIFFSLLVSIYIIINVIDLLKYRGGRPEEIIYTNNVENAINYQVYLKPNDYIDKPFVDNEFSFISSLVEYIKTDFVYNYVGTNNVPLDYNYYIRGTIVSKYIQENAEVTKPIWKKSFILLNKKEGHTNNSHIGVVENLNIGLDYYNMLVETFKSTLSLSMESNFQVEFIMSIKGNLKDEKNINKEHIMTMTIPLGVKTFDIDISSNFPEQEIMYSREQKKIESSYMMAIVHIVLFLIIIVITVYFVNHIINKGKNEYTTKVNKILKEYDDRIVTVSNFIRYERLEIVDIKKFEEILTLSDEILEPIIYWEKKNRNHKEAWFSIIRDKILYRYVINYDK